MTVTSSLSMNIYTEIKIHTYIGLCYSLSFICSRKMQIYIFYNSTRSNDFPPLKYLYIHMCTLLIVVDYILQVHLVLNYSHVLLNYSFRSIWLNRTSRPFLEDIDIFFFYIYTSNKLDFDLN